MCGSTECENCTTKSAATHAKRKAWVVNQSYRLTKCMNLIAWSIFVLAALMEVGGDAVIRRGLIGHRIALLVTGCAVLAGYSLVVNSVKWQFSKLLGASMSDSSRSSAFCLAGLLSTKKFHARHAWTGPDHDR